MNYKIYLQNNDSSIKEIRRFYVVRDYDFKSFCQKVKEVFPELRDENFTILWKDEEGDEIVISSNEEYLVAVFNMDKKLCKLYIKITSQKQESSKPKVVKIVHPDIYCDNCNCNVVGYRYKCIQCEDYDLCAKCDAEDIHSQHCMLRMLQPLQRSHNQSLNYYLRKFCEKNNLHSDKKHASNKHSRQKKKCQEFSLNYDIMPYLEDFMPYLSSFIETRNDPCSHNEAASSKETPKQKDENNPKSYVRVYQTDNDDLNVVIEDNADKSEDCSAHNTEEKQECQKDESANKNDSNKSPGEGRKLLDDTNDDNASESDIASISSQDSISNATAVAEWTIVNKDEYPEVSGASSVLSHLNEAAEKQVPSAPTPPSEINSSDKKIYPPLHEESKIYHSNPMIQSAIEIMIQMGFSNQDRLLTYLVEAEQGNINKVLDLFESQNK